MSGKFLPDGWQDSVPRDGFYKAMGFGLAANKADRPVFIQAATPVPGAASSDERGIPFDPSVRPAAKDSEIKDVICAVEYASAGDGAETFGDTTSERVTITVLDSEYTQIKNCYAVKIAGQEYRHQKSILVGTLGSIDVWSLTFTTDWEA